MLTFYKLTIIVVIRPRNDQYSSHFFLDSTGNEASQAMLISGNNNMSQLKSCLEAANHFLLSDDDARAIFAHLTDTIENNWGTVCEEAELSEVDKKLFWGRQFLNPYSRAQ